MPRFTVAAGGFFLFTCSNIRSDAANGVDLAFCVQQRKLMNDARVLPVVLESAFLKLHRNACIEHLPIIGLKSSGLFC